MLLQSPLGDPYFLFQRSEFMTLAPYDTRPVFDRYDRIKGRVFGGVGGLILFIKLFWKPGRGGSMACLALYIYPFLAPYDGEHDPPRQKKKSAASKPQPSPLTPHEITPPHTLFPPAKNIATRALQRSNIPPPFSK